MNNRFFQHRRVNPVIAWRTEVLTGVSGYEKLELTCAVSAGRFLPRKGYRLLGQTTWTSKKGRRYMAIYAKGIGTVTRWESIKRRILIWLGLRKHQPTTLTTTKSSSSHSLSLTL